MMALLPGGRVETRTGASSIPWNTLDAAALLGPAPGAVWLPEPASLALRERVKRAMLSTQRASWEQGLAAQACLEDGDAELTVLLARDAVLRQDDRGRLASLDSQPNVTDPAAAGEAVVFAALATGEPGLAAGAERMLDYLLRRAPRAADGVLFHLDPAPDAEMWSDSFYMAPPFLALAGQPVEALLQIEGLRRRLWDPSRHLFSHRWSESQGRFARAARWGVGNGWAATGMARTLRHLPAHMAVERAALGGYVREVLEGCLASAATASSTTSSTTRRRSWRPTSRRCWPGPYTAASTEAGSTATAWRRRRSCALPSTPGWTPPGWSKACAAHRASTGPVLPPRARPSS
jgi:hypothetical protein